MGELGGAGRPRVGVVGLGAMGLGMARSLRDAGYDVGVHDLRAEVATAFAEEGGTAFGSVGELAAGVDVLVGVVVNAAQVEAVLFGAGERPTG
ncbi:NAD(P)-binding domain-containing protein [Streptomyces sp. CA-132043]|uniref:NAD(P)-binding domain-containing protein n=1 Tax=Streptomyces sp. CA-132043 TaxID=3240048 RepID=UPI003D90BEF3